MSIAAALGADKEHARFEPMAVAEYPNHQTTEGVTAAALPLETDEQAQPAFGKVNPYKYGVLPILVVIQNDSKRAVRVDGMKVEYIWPDKTRLDPTPARDVQRLGGIKPPQLARKPMSIPLPRKGEKTPPLGEWEIEGRAFSAKMIPAGERAFGFIYFQTGHRTGSTLYISGLRDAATGQELLYFELPLAAVK